MQSCLCFSRLGKPLLRNSRRPCGFRFGGAVCQTPMVLLQVLTLIRVFPPRRLAQQWQVLTHRPAEITRLFTGGEG
jgi:hypothetical protein